ncbi:hypothetical protein CC78DRAFT_531708 [Lojkania enalia]|uniref:Nucleoside 2-deoxyribosyltransferase n=1 Tax=Lojkania enalia TaxID=147567 RepID=A0A9P4N1P2_9PLEO|nr:hypothetical protein CC78DRAFT_531708 [Didymosphaeria enalia]
MLSSVLRSLQSLTTHNNEHQECATPGSSTARDPRKQVLMSSTTFSGAGPSVGKRLNIDGDIPDPSHQLPALPSNLPPPNATYEHSTPPQIPKYINAYSLFLAGSIEMGAAITWQRHMAQFLHHLPLTICNPRRGHWDPDSRPQPSDANFRTQVEWELEALSNASVICFFFDVNTKSPVTMMELGLWAHSGKVIVCCGEGFWKGGNVKLVCERYGIPCVNDFAELVVEAKRMLKQKGLDAVTDEEIQRDEEWAKGIVARKARKEA